MPAGAFSATPVIVLIHHLRPSFRRTPAVLRQQLTKQCGHVVDSLVDCHLVGTKLILVAGGSESVTTPIRIKEALTSSFFFATRSPQPSKRCFCTSFASDRSGAVLLAHVTANRITPFALCPGVSLDEEGQPLAPAEGEEPEDPRRNSHVEAARASLWVREVLLTAGQDGKLVAWTPQR